MYETGIFILFTNLFEIEGKLKYERLANFLLKCIRNYGVIEKKYKIRFCVLREKYLLLRPTFCYAE